VRLAGIEPTTPWFVAKYSIQLSYSRLRQDYSRALQNGKGRGGDISQLTASPVFQTLPVGVRRVRTKKNPESELSGFFPYC
jgi:hypothetical protein